MFDDFIYYFNSMGGPNTINTNDGKTGDKLSVERLIGIKITEENIKKLSKELSEKYFDKDLSEIEKKAAEAKNYQLADLIKTILEKKVQEVTDKKNREKQKKIDDEKKEDKTDKDKKIAELKKKLETSETGKSNLGELMEGLKEDQKQLREKHSELLEQLKNAKIAGDPDKVKDLKNENEKLKKEKERLIERCLGELPKYNKDEINSLNTKLISGRFISMKTITTKDGKETTIKRPNLKLVKHYRTRRRLNKTVKMFNKIGDDPRKGIRYIMAKARKREGGKVGMGFKRLNNRLTIRDIDKFDEVFNKQKKMFIDDLETKIKSRYKTEEAYKESPDGKTIKAIQDRANYYQKAYKRKFITV